MIKISKFFIPYLIFLVILGFKGQVIISFAIVFLHEIVHYIAARFLGFSGFDVKFLPIGTVLQLKDLDEATPKQDLIISISGPLFNLISALLCFIVYIFYKNVWIDYLILSNLALGIFNLIPAFPLDGGRILRDILSMKMLYRKANEITLKISIIIGTILMLFYFVIFFKGIKNITLGLIALFIITISLKEKERVAYLIMGDIVKKKCRFLKRGYIENKSISIHYKKDLLTAIGLVDKNRHCIFLVLDDEMRVIDMFYEEELIKGLREYGNISLIEFLSRL